MERAKLNDDIKNISRYDLQIIIKTLYKQFKTDLGNLPLSGLAIKKHWHENFLPKKLWYIYEQLGNQSFSNRYENRMINNQTDIIADIVNNKITENAVEIISRYVLNKTLSKNIEKILNKIENMMRKCYSKMNLFNNDKLSANSCIEIMKVCIDSDENVILDIIPSIEENMDINMNKNDEYSNIITLNSNIIDYYKIIYEYYALIFNKYHLLFDFKLNKDKYSTMIKNQLYKVCKTKVNQIVKEYELEFTNLLNNEKLDIEEMLTNYALYNEENSYTCISTRLEYYNNIMEDETNILITQLKQVCSFDLKGLFIVEKCKKLLYTHHGKYILDSVYMNKNDYQSSNHKKVYNKVYKYFKKYYEDKTINIFDPKLFPSEKRKEIKLLILQLVLLTDFCDIKECFRWDQSLKSIQNMINLYFPEMKKDVHELLMDLQKRHNSCSGKNHTIFDDNDDDHHIHCNHKNDFLLNELLTKWEITISDDINYYVLFSLFIFFSNSKREVVSAYASNYTATNRLMLKHLFRTFKNGFIHHTNFQLLCMMESICSDFMIKIIHFPENLNENIILNSFESMELNEYDIFNKDMVKNDKEYQDQLPEYFWLEKISLPHIKSKHIIICISGYLSQNTSKINEWTELIKYYPYTEIYALHWRSSNISNLFDTANTNLSKLNPTNIKDGVSNIFKNGFSLSDISNNLFNSYKQIKDDIWDKYYNEAKIAGKYLAYILTKIKLFTTNCISLIGFSLGTEVISSCIYQLEMMNAKNDLIYEILVIGGVANKKEFEINKIDIISNKIINVYSNNDWIINYLLKIANWYIKPVGNNPIKNRSNKYANYDVSNLINGIYGHNTYRDYLGIIFNYVDFNEDANYYIKKKLRLQHDIFLEVYLHHNT